MILFYKILSEIGDYIFFVQLWVHQSAPLGMGGMGRWGGGWMGGSGMRGTGLAGVFSSFFIRLYNGRGQSGFGVGGCTLGPRPITYDFLIVFNKKQ